MFESNMNKGVNMKFDYESPEGEIEEGVSVPIGVTFFWPDI